MHDPACAAAARRARRLHFSGAQLLLCAGASAAAAVLLSAVLGLVLQRFYSEASVRIAGYRQEREVLDPAPALVSAGLPCHACAG